MAQEVCPSADSAVIPARDGNDVPVPNEVKLTKGKELLQAAKSFLIALIKLALLLLLLYIFVCCLNFLTDAFRLVAGKSAGDLFSGNIFLTNPVTGLMMGVLFTVLVQSSSTCTIVIVSLVSSEVLDVRTAIPMVMGSNIGTSMTSTLVSLAQVGDTEQFERAFAAATVLDMFNIVAVIFFMVLEVLTGYLYRFSFVLTESMFSPNGTVNGNINFLETITKPFTNLIVQIDEDVLTCWGEGGCQDDRLLFINCTVEDPATGLMEIVSCKHLFNIPQLKDHEIGIILLLISLVLLSVCLLLMVKLLKSALEGSMVSMLKRTVNADLPYVPWLTGYIAIAAGAVLTFLVQSSSVFTSTLTPMVGIGLISIDRMYPLGLGANIGTTTTGMIAALSTGQQTPLQIAFCHMLFNVSGMILLYPIPFMRWPLTMSKTLARKTAKYKWFAIIYLIMAFFITPAFVLGLAYLGSTVLITVLSLLGAVIFGIVIINVLQEKKPAILPGVLKDWDFLPKWAHSLKPWDKAITCIFTCGRKHGDTNKSM